MRIPDWLRHRRPARQSSAAGFTIIELMVVLVVLSVLALSVLPVAEISVRRAKERELRTALAEIRDAIDAYKRAVDDKTIAPAETPSGYPANLKVLVAGVASTNGSATARVYFLRRIPRDPFSAATVAPEDTWGLRSYASPPDRPAPGADVYDVYSLTPGAGLDGVPYRDW